MRLEASMHNQNAFPGGQINCEQPLNLGFYQSDLPKVQEACHDVANLNIPNASEYKAKITKELAERITRHIMDMVQKGIFHYINIQAGQALGTKVAEWGQEAIAKAKIADSKMPDNDKKEVMAAIDGEKLTPKQIEAINKGYQLARFAEKLVFFDLDGIEVDPDKPSKPKAKSTKPKQTKSKPASQLFFRRNIMHIRSFLNL